MAKRAGQRLNTGGAGGAAPVEAAAPVAAVENAAVTVSENTITQQAVNNAPITDKEYRDAGFSGNPLIKNLGERAINGYTGQDYGNTNAILGGYYKEKFGNKPTAKMVQKANLQESVLNRALDRLPSVGGTTYRGMRNAELKKQLLNAVGGEIQMKGFQSTSTNKAIAKGFAGKDKNTAVNLVINGKNGKNIQPFSGFKSEKEILFKSNSKFKIDRYDSKTDTFHITEIGD